MSGQTDDPRPDGRERDGRERDGRERDGRERDGREPVGSVAEEAAKLWGAFSGWAQEHGDGLSSFPDELREHVAKGSGECTWCPVCRTVGAIRQTSPEVVAHLSGAASSLMLAVSAMMAPPQPDADHGVERIPLDDEAEGGGA